MNARVELRQLRKQALRLRAQRHRLEIRQDWQALCATFAGTDEAAGAGTWISIAGSLLGVLSSQKRGRWAQVLSIGVLAWKLLRRVLAKPKAQRKPAH